MRLIDADKLQDELQQELEQCKIPRRNAKSNVPLILQQACINYVLMRISLADTVDVPAVHSAPVPAYTAVFEALMNYNIYKGICCDVNFDDCDPYSFMQGVRRVMSGIAIEISLDTMLAFQNEFDTNLCKDACIKGRDDK